MSAFLAVSFCQCLLNRKVCKVLCKVRKGKRTSEKISLLYNLPHFHRPVIGHPNKINPAGQSADINRGGLFGDLAGDEWLTVNIHN